MSVNFSETLESLLKDGHLSAEQVKTISRIEEDVLPEWAQELVDQKAITKEQAKVIIAVKNNENPVQKIKDVAKTSKQIAMLELPKAVEVIKDVRAFAANLKENFVSTKEVINKAIEVINGDTLISFDDIMSSSQKATYKMLSEDILDELQKGQEELEIHLEKFKEFQKALTSANKPMLDFFENSDMKEKRVEKAISDFASSSEADIESSVQDVNKFATNSALSTLKT